MSLVSSSVSEPADKTESAFRKSTAAAMCDLAKQLRSNQWDDESLIFKLAEIYSIKTVHTQTNSWLLLDVIEAAIYARREINTFQIVITFQ